MYLNLSPRKAKTLLPDTALKTGLPLELLEDLTDFYWNDLHKIVTSINHYHVLVPNLGTFHIKGDRHLVPEIEEIERQLSYYTDPPKSQYKYAIYDSRRRKLEKLKILLKQFHAEAKAKKENKILRKQIRDARENLEQQKADT